MALLRRAVAEYRRLVVGLAVVLLVDVAVYAFVVYPLSQRVANVAEREHAAGQALNDARNEHAHPRS
jgi:hypothetical protein